MKFLLLLLSLLFLLLPASAQNEPFFIAGTQGIYYGVLDAKTGKFGPVVPAGAIKNPNFLAISPDRHFLYATAVQSVAAFEIGASGMLNRLNDTATGGAGPCYISVDPSGSNLLVANYDSGSIASIRVRSDGAVGEKVAQIELTGSGPNPRRQTHPYAHAVQTDPDNKFVYACDLGSDSVWYFPFDPTNGAFGSGGSLLPGKVLPGSGPRHLVFNRDGTRVYVVNEMGHSVTVFARDPANGSLQALETVSTLVPNTPEQGVTSAEIALHPNGQWLYVSNRGCDTISIFGVGLGDGRLTMRETAPSIAKMPRHFAIDPSGLYLVVAGQKDNRIVLFKIDQGTGKLISTDQSATVDGAMCVLFWR